MDEGRADAIRLSTLGYDAGVRILSLIMLRNTQQAGGKVCARHYLLNAVSGRSPYSYPCQPESVR